MSAIAIVNPLVTMYFVKSYRNAILRFFCGKRFAASVGNSTTALTKTGTKSAWNTNVPSSNEETDDMPA